MLDSENQLFLQLHPVPHSERSASIVEKKNCRPEMCEGLHVRCLVLFLLHLIKIGIFRKTTVKIPYTKFCENLSRWRHAVSCRRMDGWIDRMKVTVMIPDCFLKKQKCLIQCPSRWPCSLRRGSAASGLLALWFRTPPDAWMSISS